MTVIRSVAGENVAFIVGDRESFARSLEGVFVQIDVAKLALAKAETVERQKDRERAAKPFEHIDITQEVIDDGFPIDG